jgi:hypothetical protein
MTSQLVTLFYYINALIPHKMDAIISMRDERKCHVEIMIFNIFFSLSLVPLLFQIVDRYNSYQITY